MNIQILRDNNFDIGLDMTQYNGCTPSKSKKWFLNDLDNGRNISFCNSDWQIDYEYSRVAGTNDALDGTIKLKNIELIVNGSCGKVLGNSDLGFRIVKVSGNNIEHVFYKLPDQTLKYQQLK